VDVFFHPIDKLINQLITTVDRRQSFSDELLVIGQYPIAIRSIRIDLHHGLHPVGILTSRSRGSQLLDKDTAVTSLRRLVKGTLRHLNDPIEPARSHLFVFVQIRTLQDKTKVTNGQQALTTTSMLSLIGLQVFQGLGTALI